MFRRLSAGFATLLFAPLASACASDAENLPPRSGQGGTGGLSIVTGGLPSTGGFVSTGGVPSTGGTGAGGVASGGTRGLDAGASDASDAASSGTPACLTGASEIALIGDSFVSWPSHTFPADMSAASSLTIESFAIGGTALGSGGGGLIPPQFDTALAKLPQLTTIIMDGGGFDVFSPDAVQFPQSPQCRNVGGRATDIDDCKKIVDKAVSAATDLFLHMAKSGVKDVVYFFYPKLPTNTILGGNNPNGMLEYAMPKLRAACEGAYDLSIERAPEAPLRCHFVELAPVFNGHTDYLAFGDIHPNPTGSKAMAEAIWSKMKEECVGQPVSSGCCIH